MSNSAFFEEATQEWDLERLFEALKRARGSQLPEMEMLYVKGLLLGYKPKEIATRVGRAPNTVRDYLSRIYRYIEDLKNLPPNSVQWHQVAEQLSGYRRVENLPVDHQPSTDRPLSPSQPITEGLQLIPLLPPPSEWDEVPEVIGFYGRSKELEELLQWLAAGCRVMAIAGSPGIGKTTLAAFFANRVRSRFSRVVWRPLRDTPPLSVLLSDLILTLGGRGQQITSVSIETQIACLIRTLQQNRVLLVLDNADGIFENGSVLRAYRKGYEDYGALFQRLGEVKHDSCVLLTGWEDPGGLERQGGRESPVRIQRLKGLKTEAAKELLADYELCGEECWDDLIDLYRGNPYNLKLVAMHILELFEGDVREFWNEGTIFLGEITNLFHEQFARLSELEKAIINYVAQQPGRLITRGELQENVGLTGSRSQVNEAIAALKRRSLIEEEKENGSSRYSLPPVVQKYVRSRSALLS